MQYAFLELPKLPERRPETGAELWAWLFVHTPDFREVPKELPPGPHRDAVELANQATFTQGELEAYERTLDEIQQARDLADAAEARGRAEGRAEGELAGLARGKAEGETAGVAKAIVAVLRARGLPVSEQLRERIAACTDAGLLTRWLERAATAASAEEVVAERR